MYPKLNSKTFIIKSFDYKENDKVYLLFTDKAGMIYARAISVKRSGAKLQAVLSSSPFLNLTLVRGKNSWRITEARTELAKLKKTESLQAFYRVLKLLIKILPTDTKESAVFLELEKLYKALLAPNREIKDLELIAVHNILSILGYIDSIRSIDFKERIDKEKMLKSVNKALANAL